LKIFFEHKTFFFGKKKTNVLLPEIQLLEKVIVVENLFTEVSRQKI